MKRLWLVLLMVVAPQVFAQVTTVTDVLGREVTLDLPAKRVVLGGYGEDYMAIGTEKAFDHVVGMSKGIWEKWRPANWAMRRPLNATCRARVLSAKSPVRKSVQRKSPLTTRAWST